MENEKVKTGKARAMQIRTSLHKVNTLVLYLRGRVSVKHTATQIRI